MIVKCLFCSGHFDSNQGQICNVYIDDKNLDCFLCDNCQERWSEKINVKYVNPQNELFNSPQDEILDSDYYSWQDDPGLW